MLMAELSLTNQIVREGLPLWRSGFSYSTTYAILRSADIPQYWKVIRSMTFTQEGQWPPYTYIVPHIYTKARVRIVGIGNYAPAGMITNEFFAYISTRLGDPRTAEDLERVTGLSTRHVRASTLELCRRMAGADAPRLIDCPPGTTEETLVDIAGGAARRAT